MQILAPLPVMQSGQDRFLESDLADTIWEQLCDTMLDGVPFSIWDAAPQIPALAAYGHRTRANYLSTVVRAIIADFAYRPDDYANIPPIAVLPKRRGKEKLYVL
jgi:hypothetical protein